MCESRDGNEVTRCGLGEGLGTVVLWLRDGMWGGGNQHLLCCFIVTTGYIHCFHSSHDGPEKHGCVSKRLFMWH